MEVASGLAQLGELSLGSTDVSGLVGLSQKLIILQSIFVSNNYCWLVSIVMLRA